MAECEWLFLKIIHTTLKNLRRTKESGGSLIKNQDTFSSTQKGREDRVNDVLDN